MSDQFICIANTVTVRKDQVKTLIYDNCHHYKGKIFYNYRLLLNNNETLPITTKNKLNLKKITEELNICQPRVYLVLNEYGSNFSRK